MIVIMNILPCSPYERRELRFLVYLAQTGLIDKTDGANPYLNFFKMHIYSNLQILLRGTFNLGDLVFGYDLP
ncbi:hypothetical protein D3C81_1932990 [compost metagenome]